MSTPIRARANEGTGNRIRQNTSGLRCVKNTPLRGVVKACPMPAPVTTVEAGHDTWAAFRDDAPAQEVLT